MESNARIYVPGYRGLVGSAIMRKLQADGCTNVLTRTRQDLDLLDQRAVTRFFIEEQPEHVFLCAAKVGGIWANNIYPAEFIHQNLVIQTNIIHAAWKTGVKRLLLLGSSCIYPRDCPQPIKEEYLMTGELESTNRPYALAKIAGIEMCWAYNRQYGTQYLAVMPTNLYGPGDNYDLKTSHVLPALIRKFHEAKAERQASVTVWGTGSPRREFLYVDDLAEACVFIMNLPDPAYCSLVSSGLQDREVTLRIRHTGNEGAPRPLALVPRSPPHDLPPLINVGTGTDLTIKELVELVKGIVGYDREVVWDASKPDGTRRKLLAVDRLHAFGWQAKTELRKGIQLAYEAYLRESVGEEREKQTVASAG